MNTQVNQRRRRRQIVGFFVCIVLLQLALCALSVDLLSSMRAYITGESLWAKARQDAFDHLSRYRHTHEESDYQRFFEALEVPYGDRKARLELTKEWPDIETIREGFTAGGVHPDDIAGMIRLYRWLHSVPQMQATISTWEEGDLGIDRTVALAHQAHQAMQGDGASAEQAEQVWSKLPELNESLRQYERRFSGQLGDASRMISELLLVLNVLTSIVLILVIVHLARRSFRDQDAAHSALQESSAHVSAVIQSAMDAIITVDDQFRIRMFNRAAEIMFRCDAKSAMGEPIGLFIPERFQAHHGGAMTAFAASGISDRRMGRPGQVTGLRADGDEFPVEASISRVEAQNKLSFLVILRDISERKRNESAILDQNRQQGLIARFGHLALTSTDIDDLMAEAAAAVAEGLGAEFCRLLELSPNEQQLVFKAGAGWQPEWMGQAVYDPAEETEDRFILGARESVVVQEFIEDGMLKPSPSLRAHGVRSGVESLICSAYGLHGVIGAYSRDVGAFTRESSHFLESITHVLVAAIERKLTLDQLSDMARYDALTGLPNRQLFRDHLWLALTHSERNDLPVGVLFVDLDRFKIINDTLGHSMGDTLLQQVAQRLQACVRQSDTVARLSGDEFAIVLSELTHPDDAGTVAHKIVSEMAMPFKLDGQEVYISASIGICTGPIDGTDPDLLLKKADTAMYRAKDSGRNTFKFYQSRMNVRSDERLLIESHLRRALERGEFLLHYQPKVSLSTGAISGLEALLRWQHPQRGLVPPNEFVSILEETGLILPVGEWVVRTACEQIARWQAEGLQAPSVAVNLSARQFRQKGLDAIITKIIADSGIRPDLLELELTESMLMQDSEESVRMLQNIKATGARLSVDDFGTGYSSLAYLKRFPLDALKVDRAFISDVTTNSDDASIVMAIIGMAHSLKLKVVAEGVETEDQVAFLMRAGCEEMQGYYFSRPLPVADCTRMLQEKRRLQCVPLPHAVPVARNEPVASPLEEMEVS